MIPIVSSSDTGAVDRLLAPRRSGDADLEGRVARIVEDVRIGGDAALRTYAEQLDGLSGPFEVSRDEIAGVLYHREAMPFERAIDVHVSHLRKKLEHQGRSMIRTVRGVGYLFCAEPGPES